MASSGSGDGEFLVRAALPGPPFYNRRRRVGRVCHVRIEKAAMMRAPMTTCLLGRLWRISYPATSDEATWSIARHSSEKRWPGSSCSRALRQGGNVEVVIPHINQEYLGPGGNRPGPGQLLHEPFRKLGLISTTASEVPRRPHVSSRLAKAIVATRSFARID